jgi:hypothetical protein
MSKLCAVCEKNNPDDNLFCDGCGNPLSGKNRKVPGAPMGVETKILIVISIIVIGAIGLFVNNILAAKTMREQARLVVESYLTDIKNEKYADALETATGRKISAEWEAAFREFLMQMTPTMPANEELHQAKIALTRINDGIERYHFINRRLPNSLNELTPVIMKEIPSIPGGGSFDYEVDHDAKNYTVFVKGNRFADNNLPENFPAYSKKALLQSPGEVKIFGQWKIKNFSINDVRVTGKIVRVDVTETVEFGPLTATEECEYRLKKIDDRWVIDMVLPSINDMTYSLAFTQMESIEGRKIPQPEVSPSGESVKEKKEPEEKTDIVTTPNQKNFKATLGSMLFSFSNLTQDPQNLTLRKQYQLRKCRESLETIGLALRRFAQSNDGNLPESLLWLIPKYIDRIPDNPASQIPDYINGYEVSDELRAFTVYSFGNHFSKIGLTENFPQFTSKHRLVNSPREIPGYTPPQKPSEDKKEEKTIDSEDTKTEKSSNDNTDAIPEIINDNNQESRDIKINGEN